jgi:hypothetical protein
MCIRGNDIKTLRGLLGTTFNRIHTVSDSAEGERGSHTQYPRSAVISLPAAAPSLPSPRIASPRPVQISASLTGSL